ncbi:hypothetical protein BCR32DRAFT_276930 [Anaeromyces robustus]|uniref:CBM10 domain-containing protein n=1 Tax=Anaeromyces robustus TaxID=1754192 RepID=A0A1Y1XFX8_9FUNG|nr:hypothetical protein BCR32DRAFT_276930 [Anaeromyces robustus]|eukprot:ORX84658.1 hypothetical protein BCR32DRAFT_276930 [Anaeromyces robustus]
MKMYLKNLSIFLIALKLVSSNNDKEGFMNRYSFCTSTTKVEYRDDIGSWGFENGKWCLLKNSVYKDYLYCKSDTPITMEIDENGDAWGVEMKKWCYIEPHKMHPYFNQYKICPDENEYSRDDGFVWGYTDDWCIIRQLEKDNTYDIEYPKCSLSPSDKYKIEEGYLWGVENDDWCYYYEIPNCHAKFVIVEKDNDNLYSKEDGKFCIITDIKPNDGCKGYGYKCCDLQETNTVIESDAFNNFYGKNDNNEICIFDFYPQNCPKSSYLIKSTDNNNYYGSNGNKPCILNSFTTSGCRNTFYNCCDTTKTTDIINYDDYGNLYGKDKNGQICIFEEIIGCNGTGLPCCKETTKVVKKVKTSSGEYRNFGKENNKLCLFNPNKCWAKEYGYDCCKSKNVNVEYSFSSTERFGFENGVLCGILN